jgi:hypothetical protein
VFLALRGAQKVTTKVEKIEESKKNHILRKQGIRIQAKAIMVAAIFILLIMVLIS